MFPFSQKLSQRKVQEQRHRENVLRREHLLAEAKDKAAIIKDLLHDARYAPYADILKTALESFQSQLLSFNVQVTQQGVPVGDFAHGLAVGKLLGRIEVLRGLLIIPDSFLSLAAQGQPAEEDGRIPNPHASEQPAS